MVYRFSNPRHPIRQLRDEMDRLFSGVSRDPDSGWFGFGRGQPAVNVWEENDALKVELEVPGVQGDQVDLSVVGGELTVKIDRPDAKQEGATYHRRERPVGSFSRVLRLPADVDADRVDAELRNGVLLITLPKAESAKPRKIQVSTG